MMVRPYSKQWCLCIIWVAVSVLCVPCTMEAATNQQFALQSAGEETVPALAFNCSPADSSNASADDENAEVDDVEPDVDLARPGIENVGRESGYKTRLTDGLSNARNRKDELPNEFLEVRRLGRAGPRHGSKKVYSKTSETSKSAKSLSDEKSKVQDSWKVEGTDWGGELGRSFDLPFPGHHKHRHLLVGVLTQPYYDWNSTKPDERHTGEDKSFIAGSIVRLIEAGGAQVVPVFHDASDEELEKIMTQINMLVIPGGFASLKKTSGFYQAGSKLLDIAMRFNDEGKFFAVHGICLGMELMLKSVSRRHKILRRVNATSAPATLHFTFRSARRKAMFAWLSDELIERLTTVPVTMENHHFGLNPYVFDENEDISEFYEMLTTSPDKDGTHYVSTIQALDYPFTGSQWHPEKPAFEWYSTYHVPHSLDAIQLMQGTANFLVSQARRNDHRLPCWDDERKLLVYNYPLLFAASQRHSVYDHFYIFPAREQRQTD